jgi:deoxyribonuclease V
VLSHRWDLTTAEARELQQQLSARVVAEDRLAGPVRRVAGADISYDRGCPTLYAAVVVLDAETGALVESRSVQREATFPYVPGYLSFREIPPLLGAFARLEHRPDLVICDGQGLAHPRRLGLACHLGVLLDLPSIGCAKSRLAGRHREPGRRRGSGCRLLDGDEVIGRVVRTRTDVKPVYVSVGHRVCLETACRWVLRLARPFRLPEPVRAAHATVNRLRAEASAAT